jgi:hypothetical protein
MILMNLAHTPHGDDVVIPHNRREFHRVHGLAVEDMDTVTK